MEQLFNDLQQQIAEKMGNGVSLIDEDCGQLEALTGDEDRYPVTFPCVLIGIPETLWENLKGNLQHGKTTVVIRLAFDCYDDTHYGSTRERHAAERMALAGRLNGALHGWRFDGCATALIRRAGRQFSLPGGIKVYEMEYTTTVAEEVQNSGS
ncbi:hypothetical protein [Bacteroides heparinolyticus]|uniref:hypothetical protein n=1 Tax=Prevotella heparinolytica TaxID=28113 RepID=UPI0023F0E375|nr:hypothetical protein [Bacteroides heparinolyticus]